MTNDLKKDVGGDPILVPLDEIQHAVVWMETEEYGGPEEGGWYYSCGVPRISVPLIFGEEVNQMIKDRLFRWAEQYNEEWSPMYRWEPHAVVSYPLGKNVKAYPDRKPHYE